MGLERFLYWVSTDITHEMRKNVVKHKCSHSQLKEISRVTQQAGAYTVVYDFWTDVFLRSWILSDTSPSGHYSVFSTEGVKD